MTCGKRMPFGFKTVNLLCDIIINFICFFTACWTKLALHLHNKRVHEDDWCACNICGKGNYNWTQAHTYSSVLKHLSILIYFYVAFRNSHLLDSHMWYVHPAERKHKCDECGAAFKNKRTLVSHVQCLHSQERPYHCEVCQKSFKTNPALNSHRRSHNIERKFQCLFCGACFNFPQHLEGHIRTHTGEKPYNCRFCDKSKLLF